MMRISRQTLSQFIRYAVAGALGVTLDLAILSYFKEVQEFSVVTAVMLNQSIMVMVMFMLHKHWSFKNKQIPHAQFVRYLLLLAFNYIVAVVLMGIVTELFDIDYRFVRLGTIALSASWNFYLYRHWVYT